MRKRTEGARSLLCGQQNKKGRDRSSERVGDTEKGVLSLPTFTLVSRAPSSSRTRSLLSMCMMGPWSRVLSERSGHRILLPQPGSRLRKTMGPGDILNLGNNLIRGIFKSGGHLDLRSMLGLGPNLSLGDQLGLGYNLGLEVQLGLGTLASYLVLTAACLLFLRAPQTGTMAAAWNANPVRLLGERGCGQGQWVRGEDGGRDKQWGRVTVCGDQ